jgi:hypothetical protein
MSTGNNGADSIEEDRPEGQNGRERVRKLVAKLIDGTELHVAELANGLVITNPRDPEKGQVHVAFADGYVYWERVVWEYWGTVEGLEDTYSTQSVRGRTNPEVFGTWDRVVEALGVSA